MKYVKVVPMPVQPKKVSVKRLSVGGRPPEKPGMSDDDIALLVVAGAAVAGAAIGVVAIPAIIAAAGTGVGAVVITTGIAKIGAIFGGGMVAGVTALSTVPLATGATVGGATYAGTQVALSGKKTKRSASRKRAMRIAFGRVGQLL